MKNKLISYSLLTLSLFISLIIFITEYPQFTRIHKLLFLGSSLALAAGLILSAVWKDQSRILPQLGEFFTSRPWIVRVGSPLLVFSWPFLVFWQLVIPSPFAKTITNDFINFYFTYKNYLIAHLAQLRIPWWAPGEASGFPFFSSPLTQTFYILNLPYALYGKLQGGISILSYQIYTIAGISIFALGLYFLLQEFKLSRAVNLAVSLILPVSFKLIETARFPNAVHTAAWFPWILLVLTQLASADSLKKALRGGLWLALLGILVITAGYPYFVYYLIFLVPPFLALILLPVFRRQLLSGDRPPCWKGFLGGAAGGGLLSLAVTWPYLRAMLLLLGETTHRAGDELAWTTGKWSNTFKDLIGSLVFPPAATSEGWIYFGSFGLLVVLFFIFSSLVRRESERGLFSRSLTIYLLAWMALIAYLGCDGSTGPAHSLWLLFWKYLPGFSSLRVWGRIYVILLPILAILLGFAIQDFVNILREGGSRTGFLPALGLTAVLALGILAFQSAVIARESYSSYWNWIQGADPATYLYLLLIGGGLFFGLLILARTRPAEESILSAPLVVFLFLFSLFDARGGQLSPWIWIEDAKANYLTKIHTIDLDQLYGEGFQAPRVEKDIPLPLDGEYNAWASRHSWHFQRYVDFLNATDDQLEARGALLGLSGGSRLFFTEAIDYPAIGPFLEDASHQKAQVAISVVAYEGDALTVDLTASIPGYLSFIDNWDPDWQALVDGQPVGIELLFGTFKSVPVPAGEHRISFQYKPTLLK